MKKLFIIFVLMGFTFLGNAGNRDLGVNTFINDSGKINIAATAFFSVSHIDKKEYLPFLVYAGCDESVKATFNRNNVVLEFKGKEYNVPDLEEFRTKYREDILDLKYLKTMPNHIESSQMQIYDFQHNVDFFPPRNNTKSIFTKEASINYTFGFKSVIYFKNPGIKKGDEFTISIVDKIDKTIKGSVTFVL